MNKKMTVHYLAGCPWAHGGLYSSDTDQTEDWEKVTCKHCRNNRAGNSTAYRQRQTYGGPYA